MSAPETAMGKTHVANNTTVKLNAFMARHLVHSRREFIFVSPCGCLLMNREYSRPVMKHRMAGDDPVGYLSGTQVVIESNGGNIMD